MFDVGENEVAFLNNTLKFCGKSSTNLADQIVGNMVHAAYKSIRKPVDNDRKSFTKRYNRILRRIMEYLVSPDVDIDSPLHHTFSLEYATVEFVVLSEMNHESTNPYFIKLTHARECMISGLIDIQIKYQNMNLSVSDYDGIGELVSSCYKDIYAVQQEVDFIHHRVSSETMEDGLIWLIRVSIDTINLYRDRDLGYQISEDKYQKLLYKLNNALSRLQKRSAVRWPTICDVEDCDAIIDSISMNG